MKRIGYALFIVALQLVIMVSPAPASILWYNGDLDSSGYNMTNEYQLVNPYSTSYYLNSQKVYDDFVVPTGGWTVDSVWSNNIFMNGAEAYDARYEIRSGVSTGDGGTMVASGNGTWSVTPTGRSWNNHQEYEIRISGLNIHLDPGTYWLNVTPSINCDTFQETSRISATSGGNGVNLPPVYGGDSNAYIDRYTHFGGGSTSSEKFVSLYYSDFSMGIGGYSGSPVPIPGAIWLLGSSLLVLTGINRKRKI